MRIVDLVILFITAIAGGALCTFGIRAFAIKKNIVNQPNPIVAQHTKPIAYLGGVGLFGGLCFSVLIYLVFFSSVNEYLTPNGIGLGLGALGFLALGVLDDLFTYSAKKKIVWQSLLALITAALGMRFSLFNNLALDLLFSVIWIVVIVNAANLTDVCDGLVAGLCFFIFFIPIFFYPSLALFGVIVGGSTLGFLFFNFPKASIFLGDAGSHLLGFLVASFCIFGFPNSHSLIVNASWIILVPGVMLFELIFLVIVRLKKGLRWWLGSPDHFSLRLQHGGFSRLKTDIVAWSANILLIVIACSLPSLNINIQYLILACVLLMCFLAWRFLITKDINNSQ